MRPVRYIYDGLIVTLAVLAGVLIAAIFAIIVVDVSIRTLGGNPPAFSSATTEYMMLYVTMFAAPWLVREHGHVRIDSFISFLPDNLKAAVNKLIYAVCMALCALAAWFSLDFALGFWQKGTLDIRSITIPRAFLFVPLVIGFGLCLVEFALLLLGITPEKQSGSAQGALEGEI